MTIRTEQPADGDLGEDRAFDQERAFAAATGAEAFGGGGAGGDWRARIRGSRLGTLVVLAVTAALVLVGAWFAAGDAGGVRGAIADSSGQVSSVDVELDGRAAPPAVGEVATNFTARTLDGTPVELSELRGRPVWLLFGATWCAACRSEQPDVQAAAEQYGDDVVVLSVYLGESAPAVLDYSQRLGITYPEVPDPTSDISASYGVMGVPSHYFIDAEGVVRDTQIGALHPEEIEEQLDALLSG